MSEDAGLLDVAEALADGLPVDWAGLTEREPDLATDLKRLQIVAEIAAAYRALRYPDEPDEGASES